MRSKLSGFIPLMALAAAIVLMAAAACGGNDEEKGAAQEAATMAPTAESGTPAPQLNTPTQPAKESVPGEIESAARKLLADELGADEGSFRLDSAERVDWSDASLGCPKEGYAYAQVITPGYKLVFDLAGASHAVHTNSDGSHMVVCGDGGSGTPPLPPNTPEPSASESVPGEIETAARKLLADELGADEGEFRLVNSEDVQWSDASLGCPKEGYAYAQVITPGYKLVFDLGGTSHAVHTNSDGSHMVICRDGR